MAIDLVTKFLPYVDEQFSTESKKSLLTNNEFDWTGAHTIRVYKVTTGSMNDYDRKGTGTGVSGSRYGNPRCVPFNEKVKGNSNGNRHIQ